MDPVTLLTHGDVEVEGRVQWSSNATFLVTVTCGDEASRAIYKPLRGERPLWDFPPGLFRREVAAYELSEAMGLHVVPPTVRRDGPLGEGSLQWFVDAAFEEHYFSMYEQRPELHDQLRRIAVLDLVANNTDRKGGHCLVDRDGKVWGIDHGLCFASDFKLRTVIWEFGGERIPDDLLAMVEPIAADVPDAVVELLDDDEEVDAVRERAEWVLAHPYFPINNGDRRYPWPLI